jgi:hypothetical protein
MMNNGEAPNKKPRCEHISKIGARCHADPQTGKDYCFFHDPEQKKKQAEARRQGGETRSRQTEPEITLPPNLPVIPLWRAADVYELLAQTVNHLRRGQMDLRATRNICYLASLLLRAMKQEAQPVIDLVADTINQFRRGQIDLRTSKTIGNAAALMLTALKQEAAEQQGAIAGEATQSVAAIRPTTAAHAQAPRHDSPEARTATTAATTILPANPPTPHAPHPAVTNTATINPTRPEARQA